MAICYGSVQEVSEPSINCPRPPISASREGRRHSLFGRAASPPCWPIYPSAPSGGSPCGIAEPLQAAAAYYASAPCRGSAMPSWLPAMARNSKITLSQVCDNHYFCNICFVGMFLPCSSLALPLHPAMARCRKLVSPPLSPPARPWLPAGRVAGRPADIGCPPCTPASWQPYPSAPRGAPRLLALPLLFPCSLLWLGAGS